MKSDYYYEREINTVKSVHQNLYSNNPLCEGENSDGNEESCCIISIFP